MYDHESADLSRLLYLWTMPRVVEDQRDKFQTDEFFINLSRQTEVRYTKLPHAPEVERRAQFIQDCHEGRIPITFLPSGFNLDLTVVSGDGAAGPSTSHDATSSADYVEMPEGPSEANKNASETNLQQQPVSRATKINYCSILQEENRRLRSEMQLLGERFRQLEQQFLPPLVSQNHGAAPVTTTVSTAVTTGGSSL